MPRTATARPAPADHASTAVCRLTCSNAGSSRVTTECCEPSRPRKSRTSADTSFVFPGRSSGSSPGNRGTPPRTRGPDRLAPDRAWPGPPASMAAAGGRDTQPSLPTALRAGVAVSDLLTHRARLNLRTRLQRQDRPRSRPSESVPVSASARASTVRPVDAAGGRPAALLPESPLGACIGNNAFPGRGEGVLEAQGLPDGGWIVVGFPPLLIAPSFNWCWMPLAN